jgi:hypothetical protein
MRFESRSRHKHLSLVASVSEPSPNKLTDKKKVNNLYNQTGVNGIQKRLDNLQSNAERQWGKMDVAQMLAHVNISLETAMGLNFPKRMFIGKIIGGFLKKKFLNGNILTII